MIIMDGEQLNDEEDVFEVSKVLRKKIENEEVYTENRFGLFFPIFFYSIFT